MRPLDSGWSLPVATAIRAVGLLAVLCWSCYIVAMFRTQQFGFSLSILMGAALFVLPAAVLPFVGLRLEALTLSVGVIFLAVIGAAEAFAALEEADFHRTHRHLPPHAGLVIQPRQWPFEHHYLSFDPKSGVWSAGD